MWSALGGVSGEGEKGAELEGMEETESVTAHTPQAQESTDQSVR